MNRFAGSLPNSRNVKVGDGLDPATRIGPIQNKRQFDLVLGILEDTKKLPGVRILAGGEVLDRPGYFIAPTIVAVACKHKNELYGIFKVPKNAGKALLIVAPGLKRLSFGLRSFEGMLRLSTASPAGIAVMGLRGRYNERGDFLITATPAAEEINAAANLFPHIIDGGGYSTQFVLFRALSGQAPSGSLQFYTPAGQPLELSLR